MAINKVTGWLSSDGDNEINMKFKKRHSDMEEGEISSDNDDDESNLEKLFRNKDDRKRLLNMTEKEREEEIFKRSLELNDIKSRQKVVRKLNEQKRKNNGQHPANQRRSLDEVFGPCSENESVFSSSSADSTSMPIKKSKHSPRINPRQKALDNQKSSKYAILSQLNENRNKKKEKLVKIEKTTRDEVLQKSIFESNFVDGEEKKINNVDRLSIISSSSSDQMDDTRDEFKDKFVEEMDELEKIRLTRNKLESWVHMPFFKDLVKGCFVRVNIGEGPEVIPLYRIAEVIDLVETVKIYDLGNTRTNIGMTLRIGKSITMSRLPFVSNQNFIHTEFDSWRQKVISDGCPLPKLSFIQEKLKALNEYSNFSISNEEIMKQDDLFKEESLKLTLPCRKFMVQHKQVILSKQRFQKGPVNIALRKAELTRLKLASENDGDTIKANEYQEEIDELNMKAEKLERKRTEGIKNISYINQRNREATMKHVEKAIELEMAEKLEWDKKGGDPLDREPTMPVLNYKKKKQERMEREAQELKAGIEAADDVRVAAQNGETVSKAEINDTKINIHNFHDFEVHLDITDGGSSIIKTVQKAALDIPKSMLTAISNNLGYVTVTTGSSTPPTSQGSRRVLNLQDYKKRKGLI